MSKRRYTYTVLRYVHDPLTAEFVNVGLLVVFPGGPGVQPFYKVRTKTAIGRLRHLFPGINRASFVETMRAIERSVGRVLTADLKANHPDDMFTKVVDAAEIARRALPADDSSYIWAPIGSGLAEDPQATFERIYMRLVGMYDTRVEGRRSDEDVWRPVRQKLEDLEVSIPFEQKIVSGGDDTIEFQHAWKNGAWHAYEALSLDLADADGIYKKAHRWLGQLTSVLPDAHERVYPHFIVGKPADPQLHDAYQRAIRILRKSPTEVEVFEESQIDAFIEKVAADVAIHNAGH